MQLRVSPLFFALFALALFSVAVSAAQPIEYRSDSPIDESSIPVPSGSISGSPVIAVVHGDSSPRKEDLIVGKDSEKSPLDQLS
ncbi:hypothetical protein L596_016192 [Steinernema carpocapsae]|uniref:Uncharacterized protein n=1 Tax=Steinernema carpocapsae TaxID=34508 RepID=A0A4U5NI86_STECR|nr:hypothetical protein L596_016192 [Steinernema carpocapsae]